MVDKSDMVGRHGSFKYYHDTRTDLAIPVISYQDVAKTSLKFASLDTDGDRVGDLFDNCPLVSNPRPDTNNDGIPDGPQPPCP